MVKTQSFFLINCTAKNLASLGILVKLVTYFKHRKTEEGYWTREHLLDQIVQKVLPTRKALYYGYVLLFLFDNVISYAIYILDTL